jgi:hypothetical protein
VNIKRGGLSRSQAELAVLLFSLKLIFLKALIFEFLHNVLDFQKSNTACRSDVRT